MMAITPVWAMPVRGSRPMPRRISATRAEVLNSRLLSSGFSLEPAAPFDYLGLHCCCGLVDFLGGYAGLGCW